MKGRKKEKQYWRNEPSVPINHYWFFFYWKYLFIIITLMNNHFNIDLLLLLLKPSHCLICLIHLFFQSDHWSVSLSNWVCFSLLFSRPYMFFFSFFPQNNPQPDMPSPYRVTHALTLWKIQRPPCDIYVKIVNFDCFNRQKDIYVLESISIRI